MDNLEFLKQIPIFSNLEEDALKKISDIVELRSYERGKTLFYEGDPGDAFYIVKKGIVYVLKKIEGEQQKIADLSDGDFFGETALIEGDPRNATIVCDTDCELYVIPKEKFDILLKVNLSISLKIMKVISQRYQEKKNQTPQTEEVKEGRIITVCCPRGGSGRTMVIANLGSALAQKGYNTVILDYDLQFGDQALMFNIMHSTTIADLVQNESEFSIETVNRYMEDTENDKLKILPAPSTPEEAELVNRGAAYEILSSLKASYGYVLVDTSCAFTDITLSAFDLADTILLVTDVDLIGIKNSRAAMKLLENLNYSTDKIKLVINKSGKNKGITLENITNSFSTTVYSEIPYSPEDCIASLNRGKPIIAINPDSPVSKEIQSLASNVSGEEPAPVGFIGKIMNNMKNVYGSVAKWKSVKEMEPKYAGAYYNLGLAYKTKGMIDEAISEYKSAIEINPQYADCHYYLGLAYLEKGVFKDAAASFAEALKINGKYKEAKNYLGLAYLKAGELVKAREILTELINEFPHFADSMNYLGKTCFMLKEYDKAKEYLKKALEINPKYNEARYNIANVYEATKELKEAIEEYQRVINGAKPDDTYAHLSRERVSVLTA